MPWLMFTVYHGSLAVLSYKNIELNSVKIISIYTFLIWRKDDTFSLFEKFIKIIGKSTN